MVAVVSGQRYIWAMDEKQIRQRRGPPDKIVDHRGHLRSREWMCSTCKHVITSAEPVPVPAPCPKCGGIAFETDDAE
jgi:rubrerythrin